MMAGETPPATSSVSSATPAAAETYSHADEFVTAISRFNLPDLKSLIQNGGNVNEPLPEGYGPLALACYFSFVDGVKVLVEAGALIHGLPGGKDPATEAAMRGNIDILNYLMEKGSDLQSVSGILLAAVNGGSVPVIEKLLSSGLNPSQEDVIQSVCSNGNAIVLELLLTAGADMRVHGEGALLIACKNGHSPVVRRLLVAGVPASASTDEGVTAVHCASMYGHLAALTFLLESSPAPDVNQTSAGCPTPLFLAAQGGYDTVVAKLLQSGANHSIPNNHGVLPVHVAAELGHTAVIHALIFAGVNINEPCTKSSATALFFAAQSGHVNVVNLLLQAGALPNEARADGTTPLLISSQTGNSSVVASLLAGSADPNRKNAAGLTPLLVAVNCNDLLTVNALLASGANPNEVDAFQQTPLLRAAKMGYTEVLHAIMQAGADIQYKDTSGMDARAVAEHNNHTYTTTVIDSFINFGGAAATQSGAWGTNYGYGY